MTLHFVTYTLCVVVVLVGLVIPLIKMSKKSPRSRISVRRWLAVTVTMTFAHLTSFALKMSKRIGVDMTTADEAIARFTTFGQDLIDKLKAARALNDQQAELLVDLQEALAASQADDVADDEKIADLQADITGLNDNIATKINAAINTLQDNLDAPTPAEEPEVPTDTPVE